AVATTWAPRTEMPIVFHACSVSADTVAPLTTQGYVPGDKLPSSVMISSAGASGSFSRPSGPFRTSTATALPAKPTGTPKLEPRPALPANPPSTEVVSSHTKASPSPQSRGHVTRVSKVTSNVSSGTGCGNHIASRALSPDRRRLTPASGSI